jgi:hypothetical protein
MEWQPIETAPKNQYILLCLGGKGWSVGCWNENIWDGDDKNWGVWVRDEESDTEPFYLTPTHWMPLPELPEI